MTVLYEYTDSRGSIHEITERDVKESFRTLTSAGYDLHTANDLALDYLIAKLTISAVPQVDLLYGNHNHYEEDRLCGEVAHKLMMKQTQKETNNETTQTA